MRNMKLVDAVIELHEIARLVTSETDSAELADRIRKCAEDLHVLSIEDDRANEVAKEIIKQVKE